MIELKDVSKRFGSRTAVDALSLRVPHGEIYGLLGRNGAGKSTAIGMMLGQVWPTKGSLRICGHCVLTQRQMALRKVGAIFESPAFYDYLSGRRNLEILSSYTERTEARRIAEVVDWVGLGGRENSKVRTYSHGMRARLALAQALLPNPELLILDEPSDGLDPEGIQEMRLTNQRLKRELGLTILLSSHLLNEVEQLCTRICVLNKGAKVFEGTLEETRRSGRWVHLVVGDWFKAIQSLEGAGLISGHRDGRFVSMVPDVDTSQLVCALVSAGIKVHEIAPEEESLETFYLGLMEERQGHVSGESTQAAPTPN